MTRSTAHRMLPPLLAALVLAALKLGLHKRPEQLELGEKK